MSEFISQSITKVFVEQPQLHQILPSLVLRKSIFIIFQAGQREKLSKGGGTTALYMLQTATATQAKGYI